MENIILTNNKDLRLVGVKVGVLSTLRFELPLVSASATHVEVIVTSGDVHSAYTATFISDTKRWQCDIAASQFPAVGKQSYEIAYELDGKQFWDGKGWIEIEDATTSGITPEPRPEPYRYVVVSVNGYAADENGAVRIPKTFISANSPVTTEGYIEGDIYFNSETGATWTLCDVQGTLTWVFNYKNYYTKAETEEAIDRVAAYYITYDAAGNPFPTRAALVNATTYYSGGSVRVPTRNDYAVVLADETHDNAEYRYIYAVAEGATTGQWEAQYPIETNDYSQLSNKPSINGNTLTGNKTGADLGLASTADATLTERFSEWTTSPASIPKDSDDPSAGSYPVRLEYVVGGWQAYIVTDDDRKVVFTIPKGEEDATSLTWESSEGETIQSPGITATRTALQGYQLGSQTDKPLASEAEAEALRQGKQSALSAQQLANIAAVSDALAFDATHSYAAGDPVVYNGTLYTFTVAHTGAWTGDDVSAVDIISRLAGKLDKSGGTVTGNLEIGPNSNYSAKFESDASGRVTLALFDGIGNTLVIGGGKLYFQRYDWQAGVELYFPSTDGTLALTAGTGHTGNLAALDADGNPTDAGWTAGDLARYALTTKTISNGAVTLDDRAINAVAVSSSLASLTINFPTATSGKVRDFGLRLSVASGITTAPELALPQGVVCENEDGEAPEIGADGAATILYFTETASGVFLVKGEVVTAIS